MYKFATSIGIDIGRTMIRSAIVRYDGKIFENMSFPYEKSPDRELLIKYLINAIRETRSRSIRHKVNPLCIGISAKGFIDYNRGTVIGPDRDIKNWSDVPLSKTISNEIGLPVFVDNDANLMALAENNYGVASGFKDIIFVALRSGIGGAIIIDGKLYRGINNAGGEIGLMSINYDGPENETGVRGSFEHHASSIALVRQYKQDTNQVDIVEEDELSGLRAKDVFELSYKNDKDAIKAVAQNAAFVGIGLANLISIFSPEIIVLGGGMSMAKDSYLDMIRESAYRNSLEPCSRGVRIERASLGYSASLLGASLFALTRLDGKNI